MLAVANFPMVSPDRRESADSETEVAHRSLVERRRKAAAAKDGLQRKKRATSRRLI